MIVRSNAVNKAIMEGVHEVSVPTDEILETSQNEHQSVLESHFAKRDVSPPFLNF